ncbi:MAG: adenylate/guanylate cyclase domain-containing protein [Cytophagales bacterium]|nr:adenylate/guanylate cyclase domain-containing protein [Cytophagales bacterium]
MQIEELERAIDLEILSTEKKRLELFAGVMVFNLVLIMFNMVFFPNALSDTFRDLQSMYFGVYVIITMIVLLVLARLLLNLWTKRRKSLPIGYKVYSIVMESLVPFSLLVFIISHEQKAIFLDGPMLIIISLIIIVSSLHLSFWLSFMSGLVAGVTYSIIVYWTFENLDTSYLINSQGYYIKSVLLIVAGACAGLVAIEFKKRLTISVRTQGEKEQIEELFSQQVSSQVVAALKSKEDLSVKTEATVLFLDIRKFTQRVQYLSPEEVNKFQNKFFGPIISCINENGGFINQIMGDGLMATFPSTEDLHQERGFKAADEILGKMKVMNEEIEDEIKVGIGIHSGEIVAGNIGTHERQQFSISGVPVILAARLEQLTKDYNSSLLVTKDFYERIKHLSGEGVSLGLVKIKGLDKEQEIIKIC